MNYPKSKLVKNQKQSYTKSAIRINGELMDVTVNIRYDDQCGNGHNSFSITGEAYQHNKPKTDRYMIACGCIHEYIEIAFPELKPFIKWHLMSSDAPMHYIANTIYHASNTDCHGLLKGEFNSFKYNVIVNNECLFKSKTFYSFRNWIHRDEAKKQAENFMHYIKPELKPEILQVGDGSQSEGKERDLKAARNCAMWEDATLLQLTNKDRLLARLELITWQFKNDMEKLSFTF